MLCDKLLVFKYLQLNQPAGSYASKPPFQFLRNLRFLRFLRFFRPLHFPPFCSKRTLPAKLAAPPPTRSPSPCRGCGTCPPSLLPRSGKTRCLTAAMTPLWGELSSASENNVFLLNALLFVFFFLFVFVFVSGKAESPLTRRWGRRDEGIGGGGGYLKRPALLVVDGPSSN